MFDGSTLKSVTNLNTEIGGITHVVTDMSKTSMFSYLNQMHFKRSTFKSNQFETSYRSGNLNKFIIKLSKMLDLYLILKHNAQYEQPDERRTH